MGEKNKRRMRERGRREAVVSRAERRKEREGEEIEKRERELRSSNAVEKRMGGGRRKRERETATRRRLEISRISYIRGISTFNPRGYARRKVSRLRNARKERAGGEG